jgi:hypothetical protein
MIQTRGPWFVDETKRTVMLRGVNLGGSSKVPFAPDGATYRSEGFFDTKNISFVGRPFPLEEADEHFARIKHWGFNFLRFLITWEAVEHEGPGIYDEEYLDYIYKIVKKAGEYGLNLFIDPHQDVWSRFSGGDGAPGWTFDILGMDITKIKGTGAAIVHQTWGDPFPRMVWITNNHKYAAATLYTLFFAGNDFAPNCKVDGVPVQEYLQEHYIAAMKKVVQKLKGLPNVVGYDTLNEPAKGYIDFADLTRNFDELLIGPSPTPWQSFQLASGFPCKVNVMDRQLAGSKKVGEDVLNPVRVSLFKEGYQCPWLQHGVWKIDASGQPVLTNPAYFTEVKGRKVDFNQDYFKPFAARFTQMVRSVDKDAMIFMETVPNTHSPEYAPGELTNTAYAVHWYDDMVLVLKRYIPWLGYDTLTDTIAFGKKKIRKVFAGTHALVKQEAIEKMGGLPTLIGEVGIPFDLNGRKAYRTGVFSAQEGALSRDLQALDDNLLSYTLWNYTSDNTNARGDLWNDEDLSLFSRDQQRDPVDIDSGGRAVRVFARPYPVKTAGEPTLLEFDPFTGRFAFEFIEDPAVQAPTEIYFPAIHYAGGYTVKASDGSYKVDIKDQRLIYTPGNKDLHRIEITKK